MYFGLVSVTIPWRGSHRTEKIATLTANSNCEVSHAMRHSRVPGSEMFEEHLLDTLPPSDAISEDHKFVVHFVRIYQSLPGGLHNPISLDHDDDDDNV